MSRSLNIGQFFGNVAERWAADSIVVNRLVHHQPRALPSHAHLAGFVSLMLRGDYRETAGLTQFGYEPFSCVYHPPGMEHHDVIGRTGVTLLTLEFRPELFDGIDLGGINLRPIIDLSGTRPAWDLMDLYRRITALETNHLDIESRAAALAFSIVQSSARLPRSLRSLQRACEYMHAYFSKNLTLAQVAHAADVHPVYLGQIFRHEFSETLGEYLNRIRMHAATDKLANSDLPLGAMALDLGFYDQSHFTRIFRQLIGITPAVFRAEYTARKSTVSVLH
ncbi:MAG TPA: helix-turn-helix transcriptional regulator [Candidatus Angelobacter sp.]